MKKINKNYILYFIYILILAVSFLATYFLQVDKIFKGMISIPGILALCLSLYKSWKDEQLQNNGRSCLQ